jgi:hypothetical protein
MHNQAQVLHLPSLCSVAKEVARVVLIPDISCEVSCAQLATLILSEIGIVHEEWKICFGEFAVLLETGDKITSAFISC